MDKTGKHYFFLLQIALTILMAGIFFSNVLIQIAAVLFFILGIWLLIEQVSAKTGKWVPCLLILFLFSGIISLFLSEDPAVSMPALMRHFVLFSLVPLLLLPEQAKKRFSPLVLKLIITAATMVAVSAIYYHFLGAERTLGFYGGPFTLATLMVFSIPITTGYFLSKNHPARIVLLLSVLVQIFALWWSFTRSAFLALILGFFLLAYIYLRQQRAENHRWLTWQWLVIMAVPLLLLLLIFSSRDSRINPWVSPEKATTTTTDLTSGRGKILHDAQDLFRKDWQTGNWSALILGHGLKSRKIMFQSPFKSWESDYLEVYMNQGMVGLALLLGIYLFFLRRVFFILRSKSNLSHSWVLRSVAISALAFWLMSFLTLQIQSISGGAIFVLLYAWMVSHSSNEQTE